MYDNNFRIIGIDVGWVNLAMVVVDVDLDSYDIRGVEKFKFKVTHAIMSNLCRINCTDEDNCIFEHSDKNGAHVVHHFVERYHEWFETADKVVIERQPVQSVVEQLLLLYIKQRYSKGDKKHVRLIAPQSMHNHFHMGPTKEHRRIQVVEITRKYLENLDEFRLAEYKDHLGDSMAFVLFYIDTRLEKHIRRNDPNPFADFAYGS